MNPAPGFESRRRKATFHRSHVASTMGNVATISSRISARSARGVTLWVALMVVVVCVATACSSSATAGSSATNGGFSGVDATLYRYAYSHCETFASPGATPAASLSTPRDIHATIYPLNRAYPISMIGKVRPHPHRQWNAAFRGCAAGVVNVYAGARSAQTPRLCKAFAPWLPANYAECRTT